MRTDFAVLALCMAVIAGSSLAAQEPVAVPTAKELRASRLNDRNIRLAQRHGAIQARAIAVAAERREIIRQRALAPRNPVSPALLGQPQWVTFGSRVSSPGFGGYHGFGRRGFVAVSPAIVYVPVPVYVSEGTWLSVRSY